MQLPRGRNLIFIWLAAIFLIILHLLQDDAIEEKLHSDRPINHQNAAFDVLINSSYGEFDPDSGRWLNISGLHDRNSFSWHHLQQAKAQYKAHAEAIFANSWIEIGPGRERRLETKEFYDHYRSSNELDIITDAPPSIIPFYRNITGLVHGKWSKVKLDEKHPVSRKLMNNSWDTVYENIEANISSSDGELHLRLNERQSTTLQVNGSLVQDIKASMTIEDGSDDTWYIDLEGVHFVDSGSVLLSTSSNKFAGRYALPHLARSDTHFYLAQQLLNQTLRNSQYLKSDIIGELLDVTSREEADDIYPVPQCEYIVYLQQQFVWPYKSEPIVSESHRSSYLNFIEEELRRPTSASIDYIPPLRLAVTIFSPDCGFILESKDPTGATRMPKDYLIGEKIELALARVKNHVLIYASTILLQVILLTRQIKDASTPTTKSKISYNTIATMIIADLGAAAIFWTLSAIVPGASLSMSAVTFLLFLCAPFFGLKLLIDLRSVQASEEEAVERQRHRNAVGTLDQVSQPQTGSNISASNTNVTPIINAAGVDLLPLPATAQRPNDSTTVILPPDQDIDAMIAEDELLNPTGNATARATASRPLNAGLRLFILSCVLSTASYIVSLWPPYVRSLYTNMLIFCYLSFWVPQIKRNVYRNCRKALRWEFVIGQSMLRMVPIAYIFLYKDNIISFKTDGHACAFFAGWLWAQILVLLSQDVLGPRFFLPDGILPPAYDYHQVLREGDEEKSGFMPIGFTQDGNTAVGESKEKGKWLSDCIICMNSLEAPYIPRGTQGQPSSAVVVSNIFARREYMITPCRHIFHSKCLDGWMKYKLQCPICRESLPPP